MPTARENQPPASARVPQFQQKPGVGGVGAIAALVAQQQSQQQGMQKLISAMQKAQVENQQAVQEAAQAGGAGATQVANQVAQGLQRVQQDQTRQQERSEDRAHSEDMLRLNSDLQRDAAKEAAAMGAALHGQRQQIMRFRESWIAKRDQKHAAIEAYGARTDELLVGGWLSDERGRKELLQRTQLLDNMRIMHVDHFDDRDLAEAYQLHNQGITDLVSGGEAMDLSRLRVEPLMLPMPQVKGNGRRTIKQGEMDPDMAFEYKMHGGYPMNGVLFNDEPNFGLPEGVLPNLVDGDVVLNAMARDDYLRFANDKSIRQELEHKNADIIVQARDRLQPMYDMYTDFNKTFNPMAGPAVQKSIENFLANDNPHKFNDIGRNLTSGAISEIFGGGRKGEEIAIIAMEIFDGKREPKSDKELMIAMALESALFNIKKHMQSEFMSAGEDGSFAMTLVKQMEETMGKEQAMLALGVPANAVGFVQGAQVMQGRIAEAYAFANNAHLGMEKISILEQLRDDLGKFARLADIHVMQVIHNEGNDGERVRKLMGLPEALQQSQDAIESIPPSELQDALTDTNANELQGTMTSMEALIAIGGELGPNVAAELATFITAEADPLTTENLPAYLAQTQVEMERSGHAKARVGRSGFNLKRQGNARQRREGGKADTNSVGETFDEKGIAGLITEQLPALISAVPTGLGGMMTQGFTRLMAGAAGRSAATKTARGAQAVFQGQQPIPLPGETAHIKNNLDPAEIQQIINASNRRN